MSSFGERLRYEREVRNTTIEEIAGATGIRVDYLEALEKNELHALPGRAFGKLYIRAYAQILGFDPDSLIDHYDREQHRKRPVSKEPVRLGSGRPRRAEAVIARWREGRMAGRSRLEAAAASVEAERGSAAETLSESPHETPAEPAAVIVNEAQETHADECAPAHRSEPFETFGEEAAAIDPEPLGDETAAIDPESLGDVTAEIEHGLPDESPAEGAAVVVPTSEAQETDEVEVDQWHRTEAVETLREEAAAIEAEEDAQIDPVAWANETSRIERELPDKRPAGAAAVIVRTSDPKESVRDDFDSAWQAAPALQATRQLRRPVVIAALSFGLFAVAVGIYATLSGSGPSETEAVATVASEPAIPGENRSPAGTTLAPPRSVGATSPPAVSRPSEVAAGVATERSHLTVPGSGVGRRIVRRRLADLDDRFNAGETAWFSTRVLGGRRGEPVRHVWLHEGRVMQSIALRLGGPDWHTHSRKTLRHVGEWVVEARDAEGRILAAATLTCAPAAP